MHAVRIWNIYPAKHKVRMLLREDALHMQRRSNQSNYIISIYLCLFSQQTHYLGLYSVDPRQCKQAWHFWTACQYSWRRLTRRSWSRTSCPCSTWPWRAPCLRLNKRTYGVVIHKILPGSNGCCVGSSLNTGLFMRWCYPDRAGAAGQKCLLNQWGGREDRTQPAGLYC